MKRIRLAREVASAMTPGIEKIAVQAVRQLVRLQTKRRKLRRELRAVEIELKSSRRQLRDITRPIDDGAPLDTPMPVAAVNE